MTYRATLSTNGLYIPADIIKNVYGDERESMRIALTRSDSGRPTLTFCKGKNHYNRLPIRSASNGGYYVRWSPILWEFGDDLGIEYTDQYKDWTLQSCGTSGREYFIRPRKAKTDNT